MVGSIVLGGQTWCRCGRPRSRPWRSLRLGRSECYRQTLLRLPPPPRLSSLPPFPPPGLQAHQSSWQKHIRVVRASLHKSTQSTAAIVHDPCRCKNSNKQRKLSKIYPQYSLPRHLWIKDYGNSGYCSKFCKMGVSLAEDIEYEE